MSIPTIVICMGLLAMTALAHFLPRFTRPDVFFGVTVTPAFPSTDPARRILRDYRIALWCSAVVAGALTPVLHRPAAAFLIDLIGLCGAQVASHRRALIHAAAPSTMIERRSIGPQRAYSRGAFGSAAAIPRAHRSGRMGRAAYGSIAGPPSGALGTLWP